MCAALCEGDNWLVIDCVVILVRGMVFQYICYFIYHIFYILFKTAVRCREFDCYYDWVCVDFIVNRSVILLVPLQMLEANSSESDVYEKLYVIQKRR